MGGVLLNKRNRNSSAVSKIAFEDTRGFLATLLVGAPALYSVEAYFSTFNEALKVSSQVDWRSSVAFSIIFLTLNIRFINGSYEHIKSPKWVDPAYEKTGFAYIIDVLFTITFHAILVIMATRCFITDSGLPVGIDPKILKELPNSWYCPGFFACLLVLLTADILWLSYKVGVNFLFEPPSKFAGLRNGSLHKFAQAICGAYNPSIFTWLKFNFCSLFAILLIPTLIKLVPGNQNSSTGWLQYVATDKVHLDTLFLTEWRIWLYMLVTGAIYLVIKDLESTGVGSASAKNANLLPHWQTLLTNAVKASKGLPAYQPGSSELPFGFIIHFGGQDLIHLWKNKDQTADELSAFVKSNEVALQKASEIDFLFILKPSRKEMEAIRSSIGSISPKDNGSVRHIKTNAYFVKQIPENTLRESTNVDQVNLHEFDLNSFPLEYNEPVNLMEDYKLIEAALNDDKRMMMLFKSHPQD